MCKEYPLQSGNPSTNEIAWLGFDGHAKSCTLGWLDNKGARQRHWSFPTNEKAIVDHLRKVPTPIKYLVVEESGLGRWIAQTARPHVTKVVVCDPKENARISRHHHKCDEEDAYTLAHLYRLGAIKEVWQQVNNERAVFKCAAQAYLDAAHRETALKLQLKAHYRQWGVIPAGGVVYGPEGRFKWLAKIPEIGIRKQLEILYEVLDQALLAQRKSRTLMRELGRCFPEIALLRTVPGVGPIGVHVFVAFIQDPSRFEKPSRLFRYCRLGIRDRSSDGKPLGFQTLDRSGHGVLKSIGYRAWLSAMKRKKGPVYEFYQGCLLRTGDQTHARLTTQRKILRTMQLMWQHKEQFDPKKFLGSDPQPTAKATCS